MQAFPETTLPDVTSRLDFLWLELTHRCNLQCTHCYSDSGPGVADRDLLTGDDYAQALADARALGCRRVQFIGGEPTLNRSLPRLLARARALGYAEVEVFTNLVALGEPLLEAFVRHRVAVATSYYGAGAPAHDAVTGVTGSHRRTVANIRRVLDAGLALRAGVIARDPDPATSEAAVEVLRALGVRNIGLDRVRGFGRGGQTCSMGELCGNCAGDVLAVGPDGVVAPCIMSRQWQVGSLQENSLRDIAGSARVRETRRAIAAATAANRACGPSDPNCYPNCSPNANCGPCAPNGGWKCLPNDNCNPGQ